MNATEPERIPADPDVALAAWRWPSSRVEGVFYDVALLLGEEDPPRAYWDCTCPGFTYRDQCQHVERAKQLLVYELRAADRQAWLDERLGCRHPLTVDEGTERACVGCGARYDRASHLEQLREDVRARRALPSSPWTAEQRSHDPA